jgi:CheY-like chemotaxis protein
MIALRRVAFWLLRNTDNAGDHMILPPEARFMTKKILIVEDNQDCCELLVLLLRGTGYEATGVHSGVEAIAHTQKSRPDLIFMDLGLPDLDGIATAAAIRQNPDTCNIPIVALSARLEDTWRAKALNAGMTLYMTKPAAPQAIIRAVKELTNKNSEDQEFSPPLNLSPDALDEPPL